MHNFPTGGAHPSELILELTFYKPGGEAIGTDTPVYKMSYLNSKGQPALAGEETTSVRDTTLKPKETRMEVFELPESYGLVKARLVYYPVSVDAIEAYDKRILETDYKPVVIAECAIPRFKLTSENNCFNK